jgi:hypothetical protein
MARGGALGGGEEGGSGLALQLSPNGEGGGVAN